MNFELEILKFLAGTHIIEDYVRFQCRESLFRAIFSIRCDTSYIFRPRAPERSFLKLINKSTVLLSFVALTYVCLLSKLMKGSKKRQFLRSLLTGITGKSFVKNSISKGLFFFNLSSSQSYLRNSTL